MKIAIVMQYWTFMDIIYGDKYSETIEAKSQTIIHDTSCGVIAQGLF